MAKSWKKVGKKLAESWQKVGRKLAESWQKVGRKMAESWQKVGKKLAKLWQKVGRKLAESWQKVGRKLAESWQKVGRYIARIISSQKIYGLHGLKHHIVEMRGGVTRRDDNDEQTREDSATQPLGCWKAEFRKSPKLKSTVRR